MLNSIPLAAVNLPTLLIAGLIAVVFIAIVVRGVIRRRRGEGGCSCGCGSCPNSAICHGAHSEKANKSR